MTTKAAPPLSTARGAALYIGALLGPSVLLLPGLTAALAGPASIVAWVGLLAVSGLLAWVFTGLGLQIPTAAGVAGYARAGLGAGAGRAVGACFLAGVVLGAPVVCLIGGSYVTALFDGGRTASILVAGVLLLAVVGLTLGGARAGTVIQFGLVVVLIGLVVLATAGSAHAAHASNWTPFDPHGWRSVGSAASVLMLSFVGWEAIAGLTPRLADPRRQLPRMIAIAFAVTAAVNLGLAVSTISVLSPAADSSVPLAGLLRVAVGSLGPLIAAVAALALTLASTNAYITGAMALAADLRQERTGREAGRSVLLQLAILASGLVLLGAVGAGLVSTVRLVAVPTALFLTVYLGCTAAAARVLTGRVRIAAGIALLAVAGVLAFSGWALAVAGLVAACGFRGAPRGGPEPTPARLGSEDEVGVLPATSVGRGGQPQCLGVA